MFVELLSTKSRALFATVAGYASSQGRQIEVTGAGPTQFLCGVHGQYAKASSTRIPAAMPIPQERFESAALFGDSTFAGFLPGLVAFIQRAPAPWRVLHAEARPAARIADVAQMMMGFSNFHISFWKPETSSEVRRENRAERCSGTQRCIQGFEMDYFYLGKCVFIKSMRMLRIQKDMFPSYRFHIRHANESKLQLQTVGAAMGG